MKKFIRRKKFILGLLFILLLTIFLINQNNSITISHFEFKNEVIPDEFNDFKIVQISDLHNKAFGEDQTNLLEKIKQVSPDIIIITGDLIDRRKYNLEIAMSFIKGANRIAPIYYVSGNHEAWSNQYDVIKENLINVGVIVLDNKVVEIKKGEDIIQIMGLSDPAFLTTSYAEVTNTSEMSQLLNVWSTSSKFKILLSHRPELFELYHENNIDLIFSGHAHGGQCVIPGIGGLFAPDQGFFPKYISGSYQKGISTMFVSRGLGNSIFPFRVFNRPEIVVVTLKAY